MFSVDPLIKSVLRRTRSIIMTELGILREPYLPKVDLKI